MVQYTDINTSAAMVPVRPKRAPDAKKPENPGVLMSTPLSKSAPELAKSSFGKTLTEASLRAAKEVEVTGRLIKRKKRPKDHKPTAEEKIDDIKDNLATAATPRL